MARTPKVVKKCNRISSSQMVNELAAKPADRARVKRRLVQPQMLTGIGDIRRFRRDQKVELEPMMPEEADVTIIICCLESCDEKIVAPSPTKAPKANPIAPRVKKIGVMIARSPFSTLA